MRRSAKCGAATAVLLVSAMRRRRLLRQACGRFPNCKKQDRLAFGRVWLLSRQLFNILLLLAAVGLDIHQMDTTLVAAVLVVIGAAFLGKVQAAVHQQKVRCPYLLEQLIP
jgi:hypothetical protein